MADINPCEMNIDCVMLNHSDLQITFNCLLHVIILDTCACLFNFIPRRNHGLVSLFNFCKTLLKLFGSCGLTHSIDVLRTRHIKPLASNIVHITVLVLVLNLTSMIMGLERITGSYMEDVQMSSYSQVINMHKAVHTRSFST